MFAMFSDIYNTSNQETRKLVDAFCAATGNDWADTFYNYKTWCKFERWQEKIVAAKRKQ